MGSQDSVSSTTPGTISPAQYLLAQITFWETYHHHKEQMGYVATALYLTAAAALSFADLPGLSESPFASWLIFLALVLITGFAGLFFVHWQLSLREFAAAMLRACGVLIVRWTTLAPSPEDLSFVTNPDGRPMTRALLDAYEQVKGTYKWHQNPRFIRIVTLVIMSLWGIVALTHVLYAGFSSAFQ